jgi:hypothetical protein
MYELPFNTGMPIHTGIYVGYLLLPGNTFPEQRFLTWYHEKWSYTGSDQFVRNRVIAWVGPLPFPKSIKEAVLEGK